NVREGGSVSGDAPRDRLSLTLGEYPVLDAHVGAASRVGPARNIADREDSLPRRLEVSVNHDAVVDRQSGPFGERHRRAHADAGPNDASLESLAALQHDAAWFNSAGDLAEMEHDAVGLVERFDEVAELGAEHTLERTRPRSRDMHVEPAGTQ